MKNNSLLKAAIDILPQFKIVFNIFYKKTAFFQSVDKAIFPKLAKSAAWASQGAAQQEML